MINWGLSPINRLRFGAVLTAFFASLGASFRSRAALQLEILALRHQLGVLQRSVKRLKLSPADRLALFGLERLGIPRFHRRCRHRPEMLVEVPFVYRTL